MEPYDKLSENLKYDPEEKKPEAAVRQAPRRDVVPGETPLRDDGIYCLEDRNPDGSIYCYMCLRFYPRLRQVIENSFDTLPAPGLFTLADSRFRRAAYQRTGDSLHFENVSPYGRVEYHGTIREDRLLIHRHSYINGRDFPNCVYVFMSDEEVRQALKKNPPWDAE